MRWFPVPISECGTIWTLLTDVMDQNSPTPVLLIVRDPEEWPSDQFVTLFGEEGYETRDVNIELLPTAVNELKPFGVIGDILFGHNS
jgi:hypothetical protein